MISALCYLQYHSTRNHLIARLQRLKKPKYLFGAMVGGLYFYWYFFRYLIHGYGAAPSGAVPPYFSGDLQGLMPSLAALGLFIILLFAWLIPHERAALTFTEAEVAFLFPAPVSRRTLVHFKLLRSQVRILASAFFLTLLSRRFGGQIWTHAFGWWLVLSTLNLHLLGSSFARTLLLDHGVSHRLRRSLVLLVTLGLGGGVYLWAKSTLPPLATADTGDFQALLKYGQALLTAGPAWYLLYPFRLLLQPFFATDTAAFFTALGPALGLFSLHYFWVIFSDVAFEEASLVASQKLAVRIAAVRAGNWQAARKPSKPARAWFVLAPTGPAVTALVWKNLLVLRQVLSPRLWILLLVIGMVLLGGLGHSGHKSLPLVAVLGVAIVLGYTLLLGPQLLRLDFRRDLPQADILKTFPLPGWQLALGEILAPVIVLAGFQWLLIAFGLGLSLLLPVKFKALAVLIGLGTLFILPVLDFLLLLIPNAAVLLFPSWIQAGKDSPRGIEATGQRLIMAIGQLLALLIALVPPALVFSAFFYPLKWALGLFAAATLGVLAALLALALEAGFGVLLLGKLFERFDVTEEPGS